MSRTLAQKAADRERARADEDKIIERYRDGEAMSRIASDYSVSDGWLALRFDEWGITRRDRSAAAVVRGPGIRPM